MTERPPPGTPTSSGDAADRPGNAADQPAEIVDALGRRCPVPVIELARRITSVRLGATIELWADDPAAGADVDAWCRMRGHELVSTSTRTDRGRAYLVRRLS